MFSPGKGTGAADVWWCCTASLFCQALFSQILVFFCFLSLWFLIWKLPSMMAVKKIWKCGYLILQQLQKLAESLGKEQKAQKGLNSPICLSEGLILGHNHQGGNLDCNSSPYTNKEMESYCFALFILPTAMLGWHLKTSSPIIPHLKEVACTKFVQENRKGALVKFSLKHRKRTEREIKWLHNLLEGSL